MRQVKYWLLAIRPKTLSLSVVPVLVGIALAWRETQLFQPLPALAALCGAILIQIGTNLHNDAEDFARGTDTEERLGPPRATAQGWLSSETVMRGAKIAFGLAFMIGLYLIWHGGWPILTIGLLSLLAGFAYTGGPKPIAYSATGELFVFLFFGLAAVLGSYYLQALSLSLNALAAGCAIGLHAAAVLLVNNYRDLQSDRKAGKLTLSHYLGTYGSQKVYATLLLGPFLLPLMLAELDAGVWLVLLALPFAWLLIQRFVSEPPGPVFNRILARTAVLQMVYGLLLVSALLL
ncbi:MAG: 1,4-dihydroxy-2-naphthoate polyprenyltransferase [Gammaproteobacteria bacterium]|nr:1,4-dihydroxy-2-naphthoate polyprenyltransferase [Gammaproteobacteria bacterium]